MPKKAAMRCGYAVPVKKTAAAAASDVGSSMWQSSRAECMESNGVPTSRVGMPIRVAVSGPIVEPQGTALLDTNGCQGTPAAAHVRVQSADPIASVV